MTPTAQSAKAREFCALAPIVPVIVVQDLAHAQPLAKALVAGGLKALEVTLRSACALEAIRAMVDVEGGVVGAGTLLTPADVKAAKAAGAQFGVAPGLTDSLVKACEDEGLPLLPGAVTASEVMRALELGYDMLKFFPAETSGGAAALKAMGGPLPKVSFCPTGGVSLKNARDYLTLPNVMCVGGSWVAPQGMMSAGNWAAIEALATDAAALSRATLG
ncbi:bifunctional 4-hydroxy-2-oxoglutarate aldolase/2-dehydro-3-deoxy-phosphogluconate aldolase [Rhodobacter capsulatus]|uniref:2-dehydro-3-deoxy-phosphogluconate aldolase n=1 Tax=Rhodobacter capsulatus (strain ATCC BAA-309 / NBRC 16581 / SB1003) TaxID=272942 RepID=D5ALT1_RHOCB|nr:bifunctional 4-hydroxy-2-oxoglutarate aldolase/2-dehydro-3-deoxy-phosphogluconate aldolase [Rhodobacter capsulatus]ADE86142.1 KHG/KDPG aldolase [Rhodobacter capsulatus SB 1003]ETD01221.1 ketohydroxyglutarate aldolase [Rhodobacter capsulatus DE442]ETD75805.1 ketohydroxyglutarate aldolase [Rhodobacter capsulatus R121]ETD79999.1 ketohydroxyglutarate aldolase [Rhodobacter capsulatus B6]ETD84114.1 ketohydroxyglutarate aldolase [Rhodobacter capsulatus YW1]